MGGSRKNLTLSTTAGARAEGCGFRKRFFNQFVIYQTQCCGKEGCFPRPHLSYAVNQQLGILFDDLFVVELDFNVQDLLVTRRGPNKNEANEKNR